MTTNQITSTQKTAYRIVKRDARNPWVDLLAILGALALGLLIGALIIMATSDASPLDAYSALFNGGFGSKKAFMQTLLQATPLIFTGLATVVAFRGKIWNIGGEGQFLAGAMMAGWVSLNIGDMPQPAVIPLVVLGSMIGGALWAGIAGYFRAKFNANEIIVTVMLNYLIHFLMSYLLIGPWNDPGSSYIQTMSFAESTYLPKLFDTKLHLGLIFALVAALLVYIVLWKTPLGYEIRSIGVNPEAGKYKGINISRIIIVTMLLSGALAGLGGGTEIAGMHHRLRLDISTGYGFTGILVAMMGQLHPFGSILAAIFFGALINGSFLMQIKSKVPFALVDTIQGVILFLLVIAFVLRQYSIRKVQIDD